MEPELVEVETFSRESSKVQSEATLDNPSESEVRESTQEIVDNSTEEVQNSPHTDPVEQKAREKGWVPKEEFKGDPEFWVSAEEYMAVGYVAPLHRKIQKLEREAAKNTQIMVQAMKAQKVQLEKEFQAQLAKIEEEKDTAFAAGDRAALRAAEAKEKQITEEFTGRMPQLPPEIPQDVASLFEEFERNNPWLATDPEARDDVNNFVNYEIDKAVKTSKAAPSLDEMKRILARAAKAYGVAAPATEQKAAPAASPVASASRAGGMGGVGTKAAPKFSSLSEQDQQIFRQFQRRGMYPNTGNMDKDAAQFINDLNGTGTMSEFRRKGRK